MIRAGATPAANRDEISAHIMGVVLEATITYRVSLPETVATSL
jgi:hypothetical protein